MKAECKALMQECSPQVEEDDEDQLYLHSMETDPDETEDEGSDLEDDQSEEDEVSQGRAKGATTK